ncbi:hypothetical protein CRG98_004171 [Punica granatum]|uniref:Transmembrane protein n=1 Tax=Punica granatum TaxID=22663 RepID=A0A2I0L469_PUNGR|nr:hypothetical protein CRG98_004171 [Punica granatum]
MAEPKEAMNEWEHVESPINHHDPLPPAAQLAPAAPVIIRDNYLRVSDASAVFPPAAHYGLDFNDPPSNLIPPHPSSPLSSDSSSSNTVLSGNWRSSESAAALVSPGDGTGRYSGVWGILLRAWGRVGFGVSVWKLVSAAGFVGVLAAAAIVYVKMVARRRRLQRSVAIRDENKNRLILLIKEKDRVINYYDSFSDLRFKILSTGVDYLP